MNKYVLTSIALLPLLLSYSHAAQNWPVESPAQSFAFSSDEGGTSSYLGVDIADVTTERLSALKLKEEKGVEVTMVDQDAPAGKAGIKEHDVILTMNGTTIESGAQLRRMIHETPPGRVVSFGLSRDGQPMTIKVQLADKHKEFSLMGPKVKDFPMEMPDVHLPDIDIPSINMVVVTQSARSGLTVENITPQLGEFFGVKNGNGVLVRAVEKGSRAEKAGFHAGDVIVKVNDQPIHDTSDFTHAIKSRTSKAVSVGLIRERKEQYLSLPLPNTKDSGLLEEESFDAPAIRAESAVELGKLQNEIAKLRPQLELAAQEVRKSAEEVRKTFCDEQRKIRQEARQQAEEQREKLRSEERKLRMEMDRMRREMRSYRMDI